jgi:hypothetical protein
MTAHFNVNEIGFFSLEQWPVTVCAWRGCCIEVFARAEHSVADCIAALSHAGLALAKDAFHPGAATRLRALDECLSRYAFAGHEKTTRKRIAQWQKLWESRCYLAHAKLVATRTGIAIHLVTFDGKQGSALPPKVLTQIEMLELLHELEEAHLILRSHLGQIKARASQATLIAPTP